VTYHKQRSGDKDIVPLSLGKTRIKIWMAKKLEEYKDHLEKDFGTYISIVRNLLGPRKDQRERIKTSLTMFLLPFHPLLQARECQEACLPRNRPTAEEVSSVNQRGIPVSALGEE
jgi:hypothetical protein